MKKVTFIIIAALFTCCLSACKSSSKATIDPNPVKLSDWVGKQWKLVELNGNPVEEGKSAKEPYIVLEIDDNRFHGNAGCNNMSGSYQSTDNGQITFHQVIATRMMCLDMDIENKLLKMFDTVDSYTIKDDTLTLAKDKTTPLARFVAVPEP